MIQQLEKKAIEMRRCCLNMALKYNDTHIAGAFSCLDILVYLYNNFSETKDRIILSKGHSCIALYACLQDKGFQPVISGHPDIDQYNGIVCSTGSLGHGLPIGVGMAFAKKLQKKEGTVYVILGDGECQEGTIWESMNLANKFELSNLVVIIDQNGLQALDSVENIIGKENLAEKFRAFGGSITKIDGHNFDDIAKAFENSSKKRAIRVIIANTVKGKGVSFIENKAQWHSRTPRKEWIDKALLELS